MAVCSRLLRSAHQQGLKKCSLLCWSLFVFVVMVFIVVAVRSAGIEAAESSPGATVEGSSRRRTHKTQRFFRIGTTNLYPRSTASE